MSEPTIAGLSLADRAALIAAYPGHPGPGIRVADPDYIGSVASTPASQYQPPAKPKRTAPAAKKSAGVTWLLSVARLCMWCGVGGFTSSGRPMKTWEHVRPRSEGGGNGTSNAGVAHAGCNQSRPRYDAVRDTAVHLAWLARTFAGKTDQDLAGHGFRWFAASPLRVAAVERRVLMRAELAAVLARPIPL